MLLSIFGFSRSARLFLKAFARVTSFWLKYLDAFGKWNPHSLEAASCFYFLGKKSAFAMTDEEVVRYYGETMKGTLHSQSGFEVAPRHSSNVA